MCWRARKEDERERPGPLRRQERFARAGRTSRASGTDAHRGRDPLSTPFKAERISPERVPGPISSARRPRRTRRARGKDRRKRPLASSTEPPASSSIQRPGTEPARHLLVGRMPRRHDEIGPARQGRIGGPAASPVARGGNAAAMSAVGESAGEPSGVEQLDRPRTSSFVVDFVASEQVETARLIAHVEVGEATRASASAESGDSTPASPGWDRISWKNIAAHPRRARHRFRFPGRASPSRAAPRRSRGLRATHRRRPRLRAREKRRCAPRRRGARQP